MTARAAAAPTIAGFDHVASIASGGFADVHLYDQRVPARRVAVKVLADAVGSGGAASAFLAEADALARLAHPYVVAVHAVGVADDGRPYLVMPFYPGPDLGTRSAGVLEVCDVLAVGVQIGGALETAHRAGLLHRDVKPANVLTDAYGQPGLADFGLAAPADADPDTGVSVPWTAPEVLFGTAPATVRSDVYSFAATLWTLLAGRPPFEADAAVADLLRRIRSAPAPSIGRPGVPPELEALLARGLAKDPGARPASVLEVVRGVQDVQRLLGLPVTEPVLPGPAAADAAPALTRVSGLLGPAPGSPPVATGLTDSTDHLTPGASHDSSQDSIPGSSHDSPAGEGGADLSGHAAPIGPRAVRRPWPLAVALTLVALVAAAVAVWWVTRPADGVTVAASRTGDAVTFTWDYAHPLPGDSYEVQVADRVARVGERALQVVGPAPVCLRVRVLDAAGAPRGPYSQEVCAP